MAYGQSRKDYEFLYDLIEVDDTVAFAMDEVFTLMANPTKKQAQEMYENGIQQWFNENEIEGVPVEYRRRVRGIKERHYIS